MAELGWKPAPSIANLNQPRSSFCCGNNCLTCNYINYGITNYIINSIRSPHWGLTWDSIARANSVCCRLFERTQRFLCLVNIFSNNLLYSTLEFLTTARMPVRGSKHLDRKRKAAIVLEAKVPEDIEVHCCGKWRQDWRFFVKDLRQLS